MNIPQTSVGTNRVKISRIGLGCVTFGREIDEEQSFKILDHAVEHGITLLDTAETYGGGQAREHRERSLGVKDLRETTGEMHSSEKIIGRWLASRGVRKDIVIQSKVNTNFTPSHVIEALNASLERLQTDYVDIYLLHKYDTSTPLEVALSAMDLAIRSRKALVIGCSNFDADQLRSAINISHAQHFAQFEVTQPIYSLVHREIESDLLPLCKREQIAPIVYSPLGAGFLTGKYRAGARVPKNSRFDVIPDHANIYFNERNFDIVERLRRLAERTGMPMGKLAMSWVFANPDIQSVLVGARTPVHIDNAVESLGGIATALIEEMSRWTQINP